MVYRIKNSICGAPTNAIEQTASAKVSLRLLAKNCLRYGTLTLFSLTSLVHAAEDEQENQQNNALPDIEFLEFLGQFESDEGEWISPESLMAQEFEGLLNAALNTNDNNVNTINTNVSNNQNTTNDGN